MQHDIIIVSDFLIMHLTSYLLSFSIIELEFPSANFLQAKDEVHHPWLRGLFTMCFFRERLWYSFGPLSRWYFVGVFIEFFSFPCSFSAKSCFSNPLSQKTFEIDSNSFIFNSKLINFSYFILIFTQYFSQL